MYKRQVEGTEPDEIHVEVDAKSPTANINKDNLRTVSYTHLIMDSSVEEIEKLFKQDDSGIYEYTCKMIRPYCKGVVDIKIGLVLFQFLHEVGHWNQFMSLDKNVAAYTTWNYEQEKNNYEKMRALKDSVLQRQAREKDNRLSAEERMLFRQYTEEYRNIPKEKEADEFALSYLKETIDKYREMCIRDSDFSGMHNGFRFIF